MQTTRAIVIIPCPLSTLEKTENLIAAMSFMATFALMTLLESQKEQLAEP